MKLLLQLVSYLERHGTAAALIGGAALAAHGIARATLDFDLLVVDPSVLDPQFWREFGAAPVTVRRGDADDPLAGVVRMSDSGEAIDVIVGKHAWQAQILARRQIVVVEQQSLPMVDRAGLVLLKLFAGGPQDLLDVRLLLAADNGTLRSEVDRHVADLPSAARRVWTRLCKVPI